MPVPDTTPHQHRLRRSRAARVVSVAVVFLVLAAGVAVAWTSSTTNTNNSLAAATLGLPGTPTFVRTPATGTTCSSITVSWTAAAQADRYLVERKLAGTWVTLVASHTTLTYTDTPGTAFTHNTVRYRITPKQSTSANWSGPTSMASITCGIGDVDDLAITSETCNYLTLGWSAAAGSIRYDIYRSINNAAFASVANDVAALTWQDTSAALLAVTPAQSVRYVVRGDDGTTNSPVDSNIVGLNYNPFRVTGIEIIDNGTPLSIEANDEVVVTFSKPSNGTTPSGSDFNTVYLRTNGSTKGLWISGAATGAANVAIGSAEFSSNITGSNGALTGTAGWAPGNTVWTWTKTGASVAATAPSGWSAFNPGTSAAPARVKCSDGQNAVATAAPVVSGWF